MVSSVLSPEKIVGRQNTNRTAAQNFISGGSILGASVVNGAANKIVGFQRAGVQPAAPVVNNIVSTISTNINNNVTNVINKTLQGFSTDYQRRLKQVDDTKPIGVLGKFLNVYKTALGFINFFGNKRNIDKVRDNLEALKKSFTESFEVAKLIRQVIIKIVKQLSNLPVASPSGGGGLNLDVDIPGGGLKKSAPRGLGRMMKGKGKMLALGAGALGLGAAGAGAVNALSDSPQAQAAGTSPEIPGDTIDKFSSIVDKFANAISNLFKTQKPKQQQPPGSAGGAAKPPAPPKPPGTEVPTAGKITGSQAEKETKMFSYLKEQVGENAATGILANAMRESGYRTNAPEGGFQGMFQWDATRWNNLTSWAKSKGLDPMDNGTQVQYALMEAKQGGTLDRIKSAKNPQEAASIWYNEFERAAYSKPIKGNAYTPDNPHEKLNLQYAQQILQRQKGNTGKFVPNSPSPAQVAAAPTKSVAQQQIAQQVSQPPAAQQPVVMPIDLSGGGQQQTSGGGGGGPAPSQGSGPSVPFLPAGNPDNFLVLYSRMVYNIVDG
jgi:hypothetical protein